MAVAVGVANQPHVLDSIVLFWTRFLAAADDGVAIAIVDNAVPATSTAARAVRPARPGTGPGREFRISNMVCVPWC